MTDNCIIYEQRLMTLICRRSKLPTRICSCIVKQIAHALALTCMHTCTSFRRDVIYCLFCGKLSSLDLI